VKTAVGEPLAKNIFATVFTDCYILCSLLPILKFPKFVVDLLNVNFRPQDLEIAVHSLDDVVIKPVKLLEQVQLSLDLMQFRIGCNGQPE